MPYPNGKLTDASAIHLNSAFNGGIAGTETYLGAAWRKIFKQRGRFDIDQVLTHPADQHPTPSTPPQTPAQQPAQQQPRQQQTPPQAPTTPPATPAQTPPPAPATPPATPPANAAATRP